GVFFDRIETRSQHHDIIVFVIVLMAAEPAPLGSSAGGVRLGIKPNQHLVAAQFRQRNPLALVRYQAEVGRGVAYLEHRSTSSLNLFHYGCARDLSRILDHAPRRLSSASRA